MLDLAIIMLIMILKVAWGPKAECSRVHFKFMIIMFIHVDYYHRYILLDLKEQQKYVHMQNEMRWWWLSMLVLHLFNCFDFSIPCIAFYVCFEASIKIAVCVYIANNWKVMPQATFWLCIRALVEWQLQRNNKTLLIDDIPTCLILDSYHIRWCFISQYHAYIHSPTKIVNYHQFAIIHGNMHIDMYILVKFCQLQRIVIQFTCA